MVALCQLQVSLLACPEARPCPDPFQGPGLAASHWAQQLLPHLPMCLLCQVLSLQPSRGGEAVR